MISNDTIPGSDVSGGAAGSALKSVGTFMAFAGMAYNASEGRKTPASSVDTGAMIRLVAPSTETSSCTV